MQSEQKKIETLAFNSDYYYFILRYIFDVIIHCQVNVDQCNEDFVKKYANEDVVKK